MPATALEQMLLELINRARLDPAAEAARFGIDLNEGLAPNTISGVSKQPLAMNETLLSVARAHSQDMIDRDYFDHDTPEGVTASQRIANAGYSAIAAGENIASRSTISGAAASPPRAHAGSTSVCGGRSRVSQRGSSKRSSISMRSRRRTVLNARENPDSRTRRTVSLV